MKKNRQKVGAKIDDAKRVQNIETEVKVRVAREEFEQLEKLLQSKAQFVKEMRQVDTYYQPSYRKFLPEGDAEVNEWLRIGVRGDQKILNYKNWHDNKYCDEYEVTIDDDENLQKIFAVLGLEKIAVVDKARKLYRYLEKYEVALDYVEDLGYFVEIEVKRPGESALQDYEDLLSLARELNLDLDKIDKRGYPYHMIYGQHES